MREARGRAIPADKGKDELPTAAGAQGRMTRVLGGLPVAVAILAACEKPVELVPDEPTTVVVDPDSVHFAALKGSAVLSATVFDQNGAEMEGVAVAWRSSDPEVARLEPTGLVTSVGDGAAAAIATVGEAEGSAKVVVAQLAASIWIRPGVNIRMDALGDTAQLAAEVLDPNGRPVPDAEVVWSTANSEVAEVTDAGQVTGVGNGSTTVRASFGELVAFVFVSVRQVAADVRLVPAYDTIRFAFFGDTADLAAEVLDPRGNVIEGASVSWSTSNSHVASVDRDGVVDAQGNGWAQVSASIHALSASVWVEVDQIPTVFEAYSEVDVIAIGDSTQIRTEAFDAGGSPILDGDVAWRSSDVEVASASAAGWVLGTGEGPVEITAELKGLEASVTLSVVSSDKYALLALYDATDGRSWAVNARWKSDAPLAEWYGVEVDEDDRVVSIVLVANGLAGELPADIGRLTALESLQLAENSLEGEIVSEVGRMESLEVLDLSGNSLDGPIPTEIARLGELRHLLLSSNELSGEIPPELGELESLRSLDLCHNMLRGTMPAELGDLSKLEALSLCGDDQEIGSGNRLTGAIPPELGKLAQLRELDLGANRLQGAHSPGAGRSLEARDAPPLLQPADEHSRRDRPPGQPPLALPLRQSADRQDTSGARQPRQAGHTPTRRRVVERQQLALGADPARAGRARQPPEARPRPQQADRRDSAGAGRPRRADLPAVRPQRSDRPASAGAGRPRQAGVARRVLGRSVGFAADRARRAGRASPTVPLLERAG